MTFPISLLVSVLAGCLEQEKKPSVPLSKEGEPLEIGTPVAHVDSFEMKREGETLRYHWGTVSHHHLTLTCMELAEVALVDKETNTALPGLVYQPTQSETFCTSPDKLTVLKP